MNEHNPYQTPEDLSVPTSSEPSSTHTVVTRVVEYVIAITLIIALLWVFMHQIPGVASGKVWP